jgi:hypothetical protein
MEEGGSNVKGRVGATATWVFASTGASLGLRNIADFDPAAILNLYKRAQSRITFAFRLSGDRRRTFRTNSGSLTILAAMGRCTWTEVQVLWSYAHRSATARSFWVLVVRLVVRHPSPPDQGLAVWL